MEIENVPTTGCNVLNNGYIDNYYNGVRSRFYIVENKAVLSSRTNYYNIPDGSVCVNASDLVYKPELPIYFEFISIILIFMALFILAKTMWGFLFRKGSV